MAQPHPHALVLVDDWLDDALAEFDEHAAREDRVRDHTPSSAPECSPTVVRPGPVGHLSSQKPARGDEAPTSSSSPAGTDDSLTTTIAPTHVTLDSFLRSTPLDPTVCHLIGSSQTILCGAAHGFAVPAADLDGDPSASPCTAGCGRSRCGPCAAEYRGG